MSRLDWSPVLTEAAAIVRSYETSVTLRQLFYRLVAVQLIPNTPAAYKRLSSTTAELRRAGEFPDLIDRGRNIHRALHFESVADALDDTLHCYRLDRTAEQDVSLYIGVEKAGLVVQLESWFGNLGIPILALGGYSSQTYVDEIAHDVRGQHRPAVLLYAGDYDPSGEDIDRDFVARTDCWDTVVRVALSAEQVRLYSLPAAVGKASDARAAAFVARHGELVQVELDALPPETLRSLFESAIAPHWDVSAYERVVAREDVDRAALRELAGSFGGGS